MNNIIKVENTAIEVADIERGLLNAKESADIFSKSHSQYAWKNLTIAHYGDTRNLRQVGAELNSKRQALSEVKFKMLKKKARLDIKIKENLTPLVELEIQELEEQQEFIKESYTACVKDIVTLSELYESIKEKIVKKHNKFDEEVFEIEEKGYYIRRFVAQSLRDIRATGRIGIGNQELLEQINLNIQVVTRMCKCYLEQELNSDDLNGTMLRVFLDQVVEKCEDSVDSYIEEKGMPTDINQKCLTKGI